MKDDFWVEFITAIIIIFSILIAVFIGAVVIDKNHTRQKVRNEE